MEIETSRFVLRPLIEADATLKYLSWLTDVTARKYIAAAKKNRGLRWLREYIKARIGRKDVIFLGIFEKGTDNHIGNIKYEPVDFTEGRAVMGVLIGDRQWRGRGVFGEVFNASARWICENHGINRFILGVDRENIPAIRSYEKAGFKIVEGDCVNGMHSSLTMCCEMRNTLA